MANLVQTAQGDLTSFIAGKIFDQVKQKFDQSIPKGSPEVEKAIKDLEREEEVDVTSVPVVDKPLRNQVIKLFGTRLEVKLVQLEGKVEAANTAISAIGAAIVDSQELIINQNQILEDKFDTLLDIFGTKADLEKKVEEDKKAEKESAEIFEQDPMFGSSPLQKMLSRSSMGGSSLVGFLLRRAGAKVVSRLTRSLSRRFIPRRIRARGRLLTRGIRGVRSLPGRAKTKIAAAATSRILGRNVAENVGKKATGKVLSKKIPGLGIAAGIIFGIERALKGDYTGAGLEVLSGIAGTIPAVGTGTSLGIDAYIIKRDIEKELRGSYAAGTGQTKKGLANLHGRELILGKKDQDDIAMGFKNATALIGTVLTSVALDVASAAGAEQMVRSEILSSGLDGFDRSSVRYKSTLGVVRTQNRDQQAIDELALPFQGMFPQQKSGTSQTDDVSGFFNPRNFFNFTSGGEELLPWFQKSGAFRKMTNFINRNNPGYVMIDKSGEPGVDFTPDGDHTRALFDGQVVEIGHQYNEKSKSGYGNYVIVRHEDPDRPGQMFDALYAHFPKSGISVKEGDQVSYGQKLGLMGKDSDDPRDIGSIRGRHMSVDFFKVGGGGTYNPRDVNTHYPFWHGIYNHVDPKFKNAKPVKEKITTNPKLVQKQTMTMLAAYENVKTDAYLDTENIPTIGFGATYYPPGFRLKGKVKMGDKITMDEAIMIKDKHYQDHLQIVMRELKSVGVNIYDLPLDVSSVLISLAFNYGSLRGAHKGSNTVFNGKSFPHSLAEMVKKAHTNNDYSNIVDLLELNLINDNSGRLKNRRESEAKIMRSGQGGTFFGLEDLKETLGITRRRNQSFLPPSMRSSLTAKMDTDSKDVEMLLDEIQTSGPPIILLNTQVVAANMNQDFNFSRTTSVGDWKDHYRIASLG